MAKKCFSEEMSCKENSRGEMSLRKNVRGVMLHGEILAGKCRTISRDSFEIKKN